MAGCPCDHVGVFWTYLHALRSFFSLFWFVFLFAAFSITVVINPTKEFLCTFTQGFTRAPLAKCVNRCIGGKIFSVCFLLISPISSSAFRQNVSTSRRPWALLFSHCLFRCSHFFVLPLIPSTSAQQPSLQTWDYRAHIGIRTVDLWYVAVFWEILDCCFLQQSSSYGWKKKKKNVAGSVRQNTHAVTWKRNWWSNIYPPFNTDKLPSIWEEIFIELNNRGPKFE